MSWPVPAPGEIASRAAAVFEGALPGIDARSPNTVAGAISRVTDMALADVYFELGYLAAELMPDTAIDTLDRHANTSAASVPLAMHEAWIDGRIRPGQLVMLEALGGGVTWGAALVRI